MDEPWWMASWHALCDKCSSQGYGALSADERVWLNTRELIDDAENGGLISYFENPSIGTLPDCLIALETLAASDVKQQVERVTALFPGGVPLSEDERNEVIDSWDDDETDELLEDVDERLFVLFEELEETLELYIRNRGLAPASA